MIGSARLGLGSVHTAAESDGGGGPDTDDFLNVIYAAGLADDPSTHNRMTGSYYSTYINPEGEIEIVALAFDDGSGGNQHPALTLKRRFSNTAANGLMVDQVAEYQPNAVSGAFHSRWLLEDADDHGLHTIMQQVDAWTYDPVPNSYYPAYLWGNNVSYRNLELLRRDDSFGSVHGWDGDGTYRLNPRLPNLETPMVQWAILMQGAKFGAGMLANQGFGIGVRGTDSSGFGEHMGSIECLWENAAFATLQSKWRIRRESVGTGAFDNMITAIELSNGLATFEGAIAVPGSATVTGDVLAAGGQAETIYFTGLLNLQTLNDTSDFVMPLRAGKRFYLTALRVYMVTRDAALSTSPSFQLLQNGTALQASQTTNFAQFNQTIPSSQSLASSATIVPDVTSFPLQLRVTLAAAGAGLTTCTARGVLIGIYI